MPEPKLPKALDAGKFFHVGLKKAAKGVKKRIILSDLTSRGKFVCSEIPFTNTGRPKPLQRSRRGPRHHQRRALREEPDSDA
jgi:hypothetical protein